MNSGTKSISRPSSRRRARSSSLRPPFVMYHWRVETISRGRSPFSKNLTGWVICFGSASSPPVSRRGLATPRLGQQLAGLAQRLDDRLLRGEHGLAGDPGVGFAALLGRDPLRRLAAEAPV